jgi:dTDP-4-amino-4,6-dideoxygalactose transaminase
MAAIAAILDGSREPLAAVMPSFTFPATAQAALWADLTPRLVDIDPSNWHLDAEHLEQLVHANRPEVGLVMAVSTFGTPPDAQARIRWEIACREAGVPLIVDSAAAFGAIADDLTPIGSQGDVEVVSFHATKPFAIGEGGAVFTRNRELLERIELAVNFGFARDRSMSFAMGLNAKMSELHAATALAVLDELDSILDARRHAASTIRAQAADGLTWQSGCERSTWQFVPVAFADTHQRDAAVLACAGRVEVRTYYEPLHTMEPFRHIAVTQDDLTATEDLYRRILCLPMANDLTEDEMSAVAGVLAPTVVDSPGYPSPEPQATPSDLERDGRAAAPALRQPSGSPTHRV